MQFYNGFDNGWVALVRPDGKGTFQIEWGRLYLKIPGWAERHVVEGLDEIKALALFEEIKQQPHWTPVAPSFRC